MAYAPELHTYVGHLIRRAEQAHNALWYRHVSREITSRQFAVLNTLSRYPGIDRRALARLTSLDRSTVDHIARRPTDRRHVSRVHDKEDRRRTLLSLTEEGSEPLGSPIGPAEAVDESLRSGVSPVGNGLSPERGKTHTSTHHALRILGAFTARRPSVFREKKARGRLLVLVRSRQGPIDAKGIDNDVKRVI